MLIGLGGHIIDFGFTIGQGHKGPFCKTLVFLLIILRNILTEL